MDDTHHYSLIGKDFRNKRGCSVHAASKDLNIGERWG